MGNRIIAILIGLALASSPAFAGQDAECKVGNPPPRTVSDAAATALFSDATIKGTVWFSPSESHPYAAYHGADGSLTSAMNGAVHKGTWKMGDGVMHVHFTDDARGGCYYIVAEGNHYVVVNTAVFSTTHSVEKSAAVTQATIKPGRDPTVPVQ
jgi:hypothetical protein